jgi:hypothetical protein
MAHKNFWSRNQSKKAQREIADSSAALGVDPRAVGTLFNAYFDEDDEMMPWVGKPNPPAKDLTFAKQAGVMFDPVKLEHDKLIAWVIATRNKVKPLAVSNAFIESLSSRNLAARSALGSYAHALHLARHAYEENEEDEGCAVCGAAKKATQYDLSGRNFRRLKWAGNVEQGELDYIGCDLEQFAKLRPVKPSEEQLEVMRGVLDALRKLPKTARLSDLNKSLAGLFKSDKHERQVVLEILGYAGILKPKGVPSYFDGWIRRPDVKESGNEWQSPTSFWKGKDGVNEKAVKFWFPQL